MTEKANTLFTFLAVLVGISFFALLLGAGNAKEVKFEYDPIIIDVQRVVDGDTIVALIEDKEVSIRLYGIDAPEITQTHGEEAKAYLEKLINAPKITCLKITDDRYGRHVAVIYANGRCLNAQMVIDGYAWYYPYSKPVSNIIKYHQKVTRDSKIGLWSHKDPVPPWHFRKGTK